MTMLHGKDAADGFKTPPRMPQEPNKTTHVSFKICANNVIL